MKFIKLNKLQYTRGKWLAGTTWRMKYVNKLPRCGNETPHASRWATEPFALVRLPPWPNFLVWDRFGYGGFGSDGSVTAVFGFPGWWLQGNPREMGFREHQVSGAPKGLVPGEPPIPRFQGPPQTPCPRSAHTPLVPGAPPAVRRLRLTIKHPAA